MPVDDSQTEETETQQPDAEEEDADDSEIVIVQPGFLEGIIEGFQYHPLEESMCLNAFRQHKEVINSAIDSALSSGNMMQGLMQLAFVVSNMGDMVAKCELFTIGANFSNLLSIPGLLSVVMRLGKNTWRLTRAIGAVRVTNISTLGRVVGVFLSILSNVQFME